MTVANPDEPQQRGSGFRAVRMIIGAMGTAQTIADRPCITTQHAEAGIIFYGPYEDRPAGRYVVRFRLGLAADAAPRGNSICARIEVYAQRGHVRIAERFILYSELRPGLGLFELEFRLIEPRCIEYRVYSSGQVALNSGADIEVEALPPRFMRRPARGTTERSWENEGEFLDGFLRNISGVIHIGANLGQERRYYWLIGMDVLWVEPIREIYDRLVDNISQYPRQRAVNALVGARDGEKMTLNIANYHGGSSSVLPLQEHAVVFPDIHYVQGRMLTTVTLGSLLEQHNIPLADYQALVLDTEGAELMILKGAGDLLRHFRYIKCEVSDFPARTGAPDTTELDRFLGALGFRQLARRSFAMGPNGVGTFWDVVWKREQTGEPFQKSGIALPFVMNPDEVSGVEKCE